MGELIIVSLLAGGMLELIRYNGGLDFIIDGPFKDTSGPSLNILIKLMSMVSIVMAGLTATMHLL